MPGGVFSVCCGHVRPLICCCKLKLRVVCTKCVPSVRRRVFDLFTAFCMKSVVGASVQDMWCASMGCLLASPRTQALGRSVVSCTCVTMCHKTCSFVVERIVRGPCTLESGCPAWERSLIRDWSAPRFREMSYHTSRVRGFCPVCTTRRT